MTDERSEMEMLSPLTKKLIERDVRHHQKVEKKKEQQEKLKAMTDEERTAFRKEKRKTILKKVGLGIGATAAVAGATTFAVMKAVAKKSDEVDEDEMVEDEDETVEYPEEE